jgi:subtilisin family serine protease
VTPEKGDRIYSNDYADLFIEYSGDEAIFDVFTDATVQIIDYFLAVVRIPVQQITNKTILSMGYSVMPHLNGLISETSNEATGISKVRNIPNLNLRGEGVLIGIIDTGIDYFNPIFRKADNTTKILTLWDQTIYGENYESNTYYGTEYTKEQINQALLSDNPYDLVPSRDDIGHGTMLAGIAAGNEVPEAGFSGVVPDAELVVVKLKPAKPYLKDFWRIPQDAVCYQDNDILFALEYLEQTAIKYQRPMSICVALGTSLSSHDGREALSRNLTARAENLNFSIVVAAGNEGTAKRHYYGMINPTIGSDKVELFVGANEPGFSMVLFGDSPGIFAIDILSPSGEYIPRIVPILDEHREISFIFEQTKILVDYQMVESQSGDQLILFRFTKPSQGIWSFKVFGRGDLSLGFHIWLPMQGFISDNVYFINPNPNTTILSLGNSSIPITVNAYNAETTGIYLNASKGFTRLEKVKPDITAPGVSIIAPSLNQSFVQVSGSSPAAAHTAGVAAMLLEWGNIRKNLPLLSTEDIKVLMARGAKRDSANVYPNRDWGYGILDVYNIFRSFRGI